MSLKISFEVFSGNVVCVVNWISCLLITYWLIGLGKLAQFEWNGSFNSTGACDIESLPYNYLIVWTKESCIYSSICLSIATLVEILSHATVVYN